MMILDYTSGPNIITKVLINKRGKHNRKNQRNGCMQRIRPRVAVFEDGGMWSRNKEFRWPLTARKRHENGFLLRIYRKNVVLLTT